MKNEPLNTTAIENFHKIVKSADLSNQKEIRIDITTAKQLSYTLGMLTARLHGKMEDFIVKQSSPTDEVIKVQVDGGNSW
jgi:hypothetical protein